MFAPLSTQRCRLEQTNLLPLLIAVCVDPDYRGKGVSNVSMPDAMSVRSDGG